jgi:hypothetical protein
MGVLTWLESLRISVWVSESTSVWAQPTILTLHTTGMAVLVGASWMLDLRLLGIGRQIPIAAFRWVFRAAAIGLILNFPTGLLLFAYRATAWGTAVPFLVKMGLVVAGSATLLPLRSLVLRSDPEQRTVTSNTRLLAVASILLWASAVTAGRLLAYLVP